MTYFLKDIIVENENELDNIAEAFYKEIVPNPDRATVVAMIGNLGSGKTTFVKALVKKFNIHAISPTFAIAKEYDLPKGEKFKKIIHMDIYRFGKNTDIKLIGFEDYRKDPQNLIFIEWANLAKEKFGTMDYSIEINPKDNDRRIMKVSRINN